MKIVGISLGIFLALALSRFVPHPPNFTSLIALSFYIPFFFGIKYIIAVIISFVITDLLIGYHFLTHWTWGSILIIGFLPLVFNSNIYVRVLGAVSGSLIFYLITNFGVWTTGQYGLNLSGLIECFVLAIPFFTNSVISTIIFSALFELCNFFYKIKKNKFI